jgi:hypothetical protein
MILLLRFHGFWLSGYRAEGRLSSVKLLRVALFLNMIPYGKINLRTLLYCTRNLAILSKKKLETTLEVPRFLVVKL